MTEFDISIKNNDYIRLVNELAEMVDSGIYEGFHTVVKNVSFVEVNTVIVTFSSKDVGEAVLVKLRIA